MSRYPRIVPVSESALSVELGEGLSAELNARVHALDALLRAAAPAGLVETVPTYRALLVTFDPLQDGAALVAALEEQLARLDEAARLPPGRLIEVPVRYGGSEGPDLETVAQHCALTPEEVIRRHSAVTYQVAMLGFAPGFAYLLGLPPELATPRLSTPRTRVPAGSVGIAGAQTGLYALPTPGGWQLIGRTELTLFDAQRSAPFLINAGDRVRFVPV